MLKWPAFTVWTQTLWLSYLQNTCCFKPLVDRCQWVCACVSVTCQRWTLESNSASSCSGVSLFVCVFTVYLNRPSGERVELLGEFPSHLESPSFACSCALALPQSTSSSELQMFIDFLKREVKGQTQSQKGFCWVFKSSIFLTVFLN